MRKAKRVWGFFLFLFLISKTHDMRWKKLNLVFDKNVEASNFYQFCKFFLLPKLQRSCSKMKSAQYGTFLEILKYILDSCFVYNLIIWCNYYKKNCLADKNSTFFLNIFTYIACSNAELLLKQLNQECLIQLLLNWKLWRVYQCVQYR